ncbi:MAG TPA: ABC transporter substrate-binding protein [Chloroflexota bacterium]|nr:ABC transporter substrate-binding protein [Chloroflexota bacterium]
MKFLIRLAPLVGASLALAACGQGAPSAPSSSVVPTSSAAASGVAGASAKPGAAASPAGSASAKPAGSAAANSASAQASAGNPRSKPQITGGDTGGYAIKVSYASVAVSDLPYYGALGSGFFKQEHLNVTMVLAPPNVAITAVSKGEIQFMDSPGNALEGASRGLPMKMVFSAWARAPWTVVGKTQYNSLAELKGKTIGTNQVGSTPYLYLQAALKNAGLTMTDVKIVSSPGTANTYGQLLAGTLDAAVVSPPFDIMAGDKGFHVVQRIGDALKLPYIGAGANTSFLSDHRPQAVAFLRALMNSDKYLKTHPQEATDLVVKYVSSPPDVAKKAVAEMLPTLSDTGEGSLEGVQQAIAIQEALTNTKVTVTPEQMVDYGPLHEALGKS